MNDINSVKSNPTVGVNLNNNLYEIEMPEGVPDDWRIEDKIFATLTYSISKLENRVNELENRVIKLTDSLSEDSELTTDMINDTLETIVRDLEKLRRH